MSNTTSTTEKVAVGGALMGGLLFFGFLTNTCQNPIDYFKTKNTDTVVLASSTGHSDYEARIAELEGRIETLKDNSVDEELIADLEAELDEQKELIEMASKASGEQAEDLEARIAELSGSSDSESEASSLMSDLTEKLELSESNGLELTNKLSAMSLASKESEGKLAEQIEALSADNKKLADELKKAMAPLKATPKVDKDTAAKMNELMEKSNSQKAQIAKQNSQIVELSAQINKFKAAKNVFVESVDDLPEKAKGLFADLTTLEGKSEGEVEAAYAQYLGKHGATAKKRIKFRSGSSSLTAADKNEIAALTEAADPNTYFFIVGYADQSGSAASNKKLSSSRSTSVAKALGSSAKGNQSAQAVYLGQTNRFGASSENRVVEIWELK